MSINDQNFIRFGRYNLNWRFSPRKDEEKPWWRKSNEGDRGVGGNKRDRVVHFACRLEFERDGMCYWRGKKFPSADQCPITAGVGE